MIFIYTLNGFDPIFSFCLIEFVTDSISGIIRPFNLVFVTHM